MKDLFKPKEQTPEELKREQDEMEEDWRRCNEREKALEGIRVDYLLLELDTEAMRFMEHKSGSDSKIKLEFKGKSLKDIRDSIGGIRTVINHGQLYYEDPLRMY